MKRELRRLTEALEKYLTEEGYAPISGRVFAYLLLSPKPVPLDDLVHELRVSKASASTETRRLERLGLVERVPVPRDRRAWYQMADNLAERLVDLRIERLAGFRELSRRMARQLPARERSLLRPRLVALAVVHGEMLRALEGMRQKGSKSARARVA